VKISKLKKNGVRLKKVKERDIRAKVNGTE
jgi:hypothetical protein